MLKLGPTLPFKYCERRSISVLGEVAARVADGTHTSPTLGRSCSLLLLSLEESNQRTCAIATHGNGYAVSCSVRFRLWNDQRTSRALPVVGIAKRKLISPPHTACDCTTSDTRLSHNSLRITRELPISPLWIAKTWGGHFA